MAVRFLVDTSVIKRLGDATVRAAVEPRKIPDLLVAAAAEELGVAVLHYDVDFDLIRGVTGQPTQWVVGAGTIA